MGAFQSRARISNSIPRGVLMGFLQMCFWGCYKMPRWDHQCIDKCQHGRKRRSFCGFSVDFSCEDRRYFSWRLTFEEGWLSSPGRILGSNIITSLGGGFKNCFFSSLFGEDSHFDEHIFQMGWFNHQLDSDLVVTLFEQLVTKQLD